MGGRGDSNPYRRGHPFGSGNCGDHRVFPADGIYGHRRHSQRSVALADRHQRTGRHHPDQRTHLLRRQRRFSLPQHGNHNGSRKGRTPHRIRVGYRFAATGVGSRPGDGPRRLARPAHSPPAGVPSEASQQQERVRQRLSNVVTDHKRTILVFRSAPHLFLMLDNLCPNIQRNVRVLAVLIAAGGAMGAQPQSSKQFHLQEAGIADIQRTIMAEKITSTGLVELYLRRIKAYNNTCVNEPMGILGPITTIPHARQVNALSTLNLRPPARRTWGFDERKARSMTDMDDKNPNMPDALEVAAAQDRQFRQTGRLVGPLHGVVMAIKDQYDTFDMRTTSGADAQYANDRPPQDATFVKRLRNAGAILLAKANLAEYATDGARSSFGGTFCNPYDTEREPGMSSAGSASSVAANLVACAIGEETVVSIRWPASVNSLVGLAPTEELVSRKGMMGAGLN